VNIKVNLSAFKNDLERASEALYAGIERGVEEAAAQVERAAKKNLKGDARGKHLMTSIHSEVQSVYGGFVVGKIGVGGATDIEGDAGENFGIYVHEGTGIYSRTGMGRKDVPWFYMDANYIGHQTSGMQANPFLENAYNEMSPKVAKIIARALKGG
jgi:HK97 gp10 family phage protein